MLPVAELEEFISGCNVGWLIPVLAHNLRKASSVNSPTMLRPQPESRMANPGLDTSRTVSVPQSASVEASPAARLCCPPASRLRSAQSPGAEDKLAKDAKGSFIMTLLHGRALECVEHLQPEECQKEGGDCVILDILDLRWPQKNRTDEIGEQVSLVFMLKATEGETIRTWCARARETFHSCHRKAGISFSEEAIGWLRLNCSGMTEEQRAVVLARANGNLKVGESQAMRSCFPEYVVRINEEEVVEVLAASWKDKRKELAKLQQARRFHEAANLR